MSQPVSNGQFFVVSGTAVGTSTLFARSGSLTRLVIPANKTGTVDFYDSASGTNANLIASVPCTVGSIPTSIEFGGCVKNGLTYVTSGTTSLVVVTD